MELSHAPECPRPLGLERPQRLGEPGLSKEDEEEGKTAMGLLIGWATTSVWPQESKY